MGTLLPNVGDTVTLKDARDGQKYTVAKLADGKYWMTENLNLAGGTALSADDTDVTSTYISSFSTSNNLIKEGNSIKLPNSAPAFSADNISFVYNSGNKTNCGSSGQNTPCYSYYSWDAATLGSGRNLDTANIDASQSICPKGWKLPTSGSPSDNGWKRGDVYTLATAYGANLEESNEDSSATFYNNAGPSTTPNFLLGGYYGYGSNSYYGYYGNYWSSTSYNNTYAMSFDLGSGRFRITALSRALGPSVRCLFNTSAQSANSNQSSNSSQSVTPSQTPASTQSISNNTAEPSRATPLAMSAPTQNATPATSQEAPQDDSSTDTSDTTDSTDSTDSTTTPNPSSTTTSPHGVTATDLSDNGEKQAFAVRTSLAIAAGTTATAGTILFLLAKRKKDEEDEESENSQS